MNTNFCVSLLLPVLAASLCAQDLQLDVKASPESVHATATGAKEGALVVLVLGMHETRLRLPGGQILGVEPDVTSFAFAGADSAATFYFRLPRHGDSLECFAQAVAIVPRTPADAPGTFTVSDVQKVSTKG